nr:beta-catenin-like protein 1 [Zootoca vivipara]
MELYFKYLDAMQAADKKIEGEKHDMVRRGEIIDDDMEDEFYLRRLDAGLFVLQLICYIMAEICNASIPQIRQRVHQILNMRGSSIKIVRHIIKGESLSPGVGERLLFGQHRLLFGQQPQQKAGSQPCSLRHVELGKRPPLCLFIWPPRPLLANPAFQPHCAACEIVESKCSMQSPRQQQGLGWALWLLACGLLH